MKISLGGIVTNGKASTARHLCSSVAVSLKSWGYTSLFKHSLKIMRGKFYIEIVAFVGYEIYESSVSSEGIWNTYTY